MIAWWSSTTVVQIIPVDYISRAQGQKIGFPNAMLKNLFV